MAKGAAAAAAPAVPATTSEATGTTQLPLSRVKKLIALDPDLNACSNPAAFLITRATELFIQQLTQNAHAVVRSERKPRKGIQYKDLAAAVARNDNFEFLSDVVPPMIPYKEAKAKKGKKAAGGAGVGEDEGGAKGKKQMKLGKNFEVVIEQKNGSGEVANGHAKESEEEEADPEAQLRSESRKERISLSGSGILNGDDEQDRDADVQMK